jgi:hypothetical protein
MFTKQLSFLALIFLIGVSCNDGPKTPDVSNVKINLTVRRFDQDFFKTDTLNLSYSLKALEKKYPYFYTDFIEKIVALSTEDNINFSINIKKFIHDYKPIFDSSKTIEKGIEEATSETKEALKYVAYYFPGYKLPNEFIPFIGPMDAFVNTATGIQSEIITTNALCTGLQLHLGGKSSFYTSEPGQQLYPEYLSRRFTTEYISVNCMKNIIDDIMPLNYNSKNFLEILVDHGKRMYLLDLFLPNKKDEFKLGYTTAQLKGVTDNEGLIWNYFTENNLLYETDLLKIRSFIGDAPETVEFGQGSPGFVSLFVGREIVDTYMRKNESTTIDQLIIMDAAKILAGSKYKPR